MFGRPADGFDARCAAAGATIKKRFKTPEQLAVEGWCTLVDGPRPGGEIVTAWGCFQFNRDAWWDAGGVGLPWECDQVEEIQRPTRTYATNWRRCLSAGVDPVVGAFLWQASPAQFERYLRGQGAGEYANVVNRHAAGVAGWA